MPLSPLVREQFLAGLRCRRRLWLGVHRPNLGRADDGLAQDHADRRQWVRRAARTHVPGGVRVDVADGDLRDHCDATEEQIAGGCTLLYGATFEYDGVYSVSDVIEKGRAGWTVYVVDPATGVEPQHVNDLALQSYVLQGAGLWVTRAMLAHPRTPCLHPEYHPYFEKVDLTVEVERLLPQLPSQVIAQTNMIFGPRPEVPMGAHCMTPTTCRYLEYCEERAVRPGPEPALAPGDAPLDIRGRRPQPPEAGA